MGFETHRREGWTPSTTAAGCGDHTEGDLDSIFSNWCYLAALAWRGYQDVGCGAIVVNVSSDVADVSYAGGSPADHYTRYVERYDPSAQLVIAQKE